MQEAAVSVSHADSNIRWAVEIEERPQIISLVLLCIAIALMLILIG